MTQEQVEKILHDFKSVAVNMNRLKDAYDSLYNDIETLLKDDLCGKTNSQAVGTSSQS